MRYFVANCYQKLRLSRRHSDCELEKHKLHTELMSEEQLTAFLAKVKGDSSLQEKLKAASTPDAVVAIAKETGFTISSDELKRVSQFNLLSDEELEGVAGGAYCSKTICVSLFSCA